MTVDTANVPPSDFRALALQVRAAGLLDRRRAYYVTTIALTIAALAAAWTLFVIVGNSWAILGVAALLGLVFAHLGFLGHDAGHQQMFATRRANRAVGLLVGNALIGMSLGWWVPKHNAHHAHPNELGADPDVGADRFGIFGDAEAEERERTGAARLLVRWRAPLFFPLMLLRSVALHGGGIRGLLARRDRAAVGEGLLMLLHAVTYFTLVALVLGPLHALAFVVVQQAVFSVYLGLSFAPNHKGMPLVPPGSAMDFASRQILTSRNVAGGVLGTFLLGGLDLQVEHHLFPSMPRPNLRRARSLVQAYCRANDLPYCETSFIESQRMIVRHLRTGEAERPAVEADLGVVATDPVRP